jgi:glucose/arabinose dehydrogenase
VSVPEALARLVGTVLVAADALAGVAPGPPPRLQAVEVARVPLAVGLSFPPAGPPLVVAQDGRVVTLGRRPRTVLDLRGRTRAADEQGLLSVVAHPRWPADGRLFVHLTDRAGDTRVTEERRTPGGAWRSRVLLAVDQPYSNHNGGELAWAPDGRLLVGLGDGGDAFDPQDRVQDPGSPFGKLIALRVDGDPSPATLALGLRNPWRIAVDRATGVVWAADVGQDEQEEIDAIPLDGRMRNYGWPRWEGTHLHAHRAMSHVGAPTPPAAAYGHDVGCSVIGGGVVRGPQAPPGLADRYVFADFCRGRLASFPVRGAERAGPVRWERTPVPGAVAVAVSPAGAVYVVRRDGTVARLRAAARRPAATGQARAGASAPSSSASAGPAREASTPAAALPAETPAYTNELPQAKASVRRASSAMPGTAS